uniref:Ig-like domain-containing protein n=1 Tax=Periophthalmus magnuspinnatus TaxID=409849 RepID=A0A3B4A419_9GOBI
MNTREQVFVTRFRVGHTGLNRTLFLKGKLSSGLCECGLELEMVEHVILNSVQVIGGNVSVVLGETAIFPCLLQETTESLTQITWQRRTRLIKDNTNFYTISSKNGPSYFNGPDERFSFAGNISLRNGSLQLSNVTRSDEGTYTCIFTLFPSGNFKTEIPLNVLGITTVLFTVCTALKIQNVLDEIK